MKQMKTILTVFLAAMLSLCSNAQQVAQQQGVKEFYPLSWEGLKSVNPTKEQEKQFRNLLNDYRKKRSAIKADSAMSAEEKGNAYREINRYRSNQYWKHILTSEQAKLLKKKVNENKKGATKGK